MLLFLLTISDESHHDKIEQIYNDYHDQMIKFTSVKLQLSKTKYNQEEVEDIVQNTFMKIVKYINNIKLSWGAENVRGYCFAILNNEIQNYLNEVQDISPLPIELSDNEKYSILDEIVIRESYSAVVDAITKLDEKYSTTLFLIYCKDMTVKEVADLMDISPKTVYTRLARGKKKLLEALKGADIYD